MAGRLESKVAFITGTGGGQGRAAAQIFAREGAKVVGCDLKKEGGEKTAAMIEAAGGDSIFRVVDLGDGEQVKEWLEWGIAHYGQIDILYNNASAPKFAPIEQMTWDEWHFTVRNELDLIYWACHHAFPMMKERGGVIINTASTAGVIGFANLGDFAHAATKGGVIALTRQLAARRVSVQHTGQQHLAWAGRNPGDSGDDAGPAIPRRVCRAAHDQAPGPAGGYCLLRDLPGFRRSLLGDRRELPHRRRSDGMVGRAIGEMDDD